MRLGPTGSIGFLFSPSSCFSESATPRGRGPALVFDAIGGEKKKKKGIGEEFGTGTWTGACLFGAPTEMTWIRSEQASETFIRGRLGVVRSLRPVVLVRGGATAAAGAASGSRSGRGAGGWSAKRGGTTGGWRPGHGAFDPAKVASPRSVSFVTQAARRRSQTAGVQIQQTGDGVGLHGIRRN